MVKHILYTIQWNIHTHKIHKFIQISSNFQYLYHQLLPNVVEVSAQELSTHWWRGHEKTTAFPCQVSVKLFVISVPETCRDLGTKWPPGSIDFCSPQVWLWYNMFPRLVYRSTSIRPRPPVCPNSQLLAARRPKQSVLLAKPLQTSSFIMLQPGRNSNSAVVASTVLVMLLLQLYCCKMLIVLFFHFVVDFAVSALQFLCAFCSSVLLLILLFFVFFLLPCLFFFSVCFCVYCTCLGTS